MKTHPEGKYGEGGKEIGKKNSFSQWKGVVRKLSWRQWISGVVLYNNDGCVCLCMPVCVCVSLYVTDRVKTFYRSEGIKADPTLKVHLRVKPRFRHLDVVRVSVGVGEYVHMCRACMAARMTTLLSDSKTHTAATCRLEPSSIQQ